MITVNEYEVSFFSAIKSKVAKKKGVSQKEEGVLTVYRLLAPSLYQAERQAWRSLKEDFQKGVFGEDWGLENVTKAETFLFA
jgi:hypothetical protein